MTPGYAGTLYSIGLLRIIGENVIVLPDQDVHRTALFITLLTYANEPVCYSLRHVNVTMFSHQVPNS